MFEVSDPADYANTHSSVGGTEAEITSQWLGARHSYMYGEVF